MSDTIYSYYDVKLTDLQAYNLGFTKRTPKMDQNLNITGKVCIRIDRPPRGTEGIRKYKVSYSFCSPNDNFSKKRVRNVASSRMAASFFTWIESPIPLKSGEISEQAVKKFSSSSILMERGTMKIPRWMENTSLVPRYRRKAKKA